MALTTNKLRVQNELSRIAYDYEFPTVKYKRDTNEAYLLDTIHPKTAYANEVGAEFNVAERNRQRRVRERSTWRFEFRLTFTQEVSLESFENLLTVSPVLLPRTDTLQQVELNLVSSEVTHPPIQAPSTGTTVTYIIEANEYPR